MLGKKRSRVPQVYFPFSLRSPTQQTRRENVSERSQHHLLIWGLHHLDNTTMPQFLLTWHKPPYIWETDSPLISCLHQIGQLDQVFPLTGDSGSLKLVQNKSPPLLYLLSKSSRKPRSVSPSTLLDPLLCSTLYAGSSHSILGTSQAHEWGRKVNYIVKYIYCIFFSFGTLYWTQGFNMKTLGVYKYLIQSSMSDC